MRSRNAVAWIIIILTLVFISKAHSAPPEFKPVCEITVPGEGWGSGTLIAANDTKGLILTVNHVVGEPGHKEKFAWLLAGGRSYGGTTLEHLVDGKDKRWEASDLALAVCPRPRDNTGRYILPAIIASFDKSEGPWYGVGFVDKRLVIVKSDRCKYDNGLLTFGHMFIPGQSGGPVFNRKGEVVGVISSYNEQFDFGVAIDGPNLKKLLAKYGL